MWDTKAKGWNSVSKGPQLNMAALHGQAFRKKGLKFLIAMHHGMGYYTAAQEGHTFIDHDSKNRSLLMSISPMPDGSIPQQQKDLLNAFGAFLKQNGTTIYNTRAWMVYGEGPSNIGGRAISRP